jgi:hypothetical protein
MLWVKQVLGWVASFFVSSFVGWVAQLLCVSTISHCGLDNPINPKHIWGKHSLMGWKTQVEPNSIAALTS